jgi:hypothetical protein
MLYSEHLQLAEAFSRVMKLAEKSYDDKEKNLADFHELARDAVSLEIVRKMHAAYILCYQLSPEQRQERGRS